MKILIAEDEEDIRNLIKMGLEEGGYKVVAAKNGREALDIFAQEPFDLAVLDVMMPLADGYAVLRGIRAKSNIPVLFLTAKAEDIDKVIGLGAGADDYIAKPFSMSELTARVGAHLRRSKQYFAAPEPVPTEMICGSLRLNTAECAVYKNGTPLELGTKEYKLLRHFMEQPGRVFTKQQLYAAVWDEEYYFDDNTVMVHINRLRGKIEDDPQSPRYILTVRGIGYKLKKA